MFNGTDELEEFVCPSGTALELKFGMMYYFVISVI